MTVTPTDNQIHDAQNSFSISHNVVSQTGQPLFPAVALTVTITNDDQCACTPPSAAPAPTSEPCPHRCAGCYA